jgi:hypothetical protein
MSPATSQNDTMQFPFVGLSQTGTQLKKKSKQDEL